ncbi:MAG: glycosyltransferase [Thermoleophilia bacterium]
MSAALRIALVHPHALPARDDVARHVGAEGAALAARGHRVTILAPAGGREDVARGRALLAAAAAGDAEALLAPPGAVREVALGRGLPAGAGRRVGEPFDLAGALETALTRAPFDVVHLHEPLAPSPALAALRHAPAVTAVTFHRAEPLVGVAFLRPLVDRALARADLRIATTETGRAALTELLPGGYRVIAPGVDPALDAPTPLPDGPPGLVLVARGRDRVGVRFALSVLRGLDLDGLGPVTLIGPAEAPWRTRAAVPKTLRERIAVVPDPGPEGRAAAFAGAAIVAVAGPDEAAGPALREALAMGRVVLAPRSPAADEALGHGVDALVLSPFAREAWIEAVEGLVAAPERRATLAQAAAGTPRRTWGDVAADLEAAYRAALADRARDAAAPRILADLRVRPGEGLSATRIVDACRERGVGAVGVAAPEGLAAARAVAAAAPEDLLVIPGQEIRTTEGVLVGLFLTDDVPTGLPPADAAAAVHAQGGVVLLPHPDAADVPPPATLHRLGAAVDCVEVLTPGAAPPADEGLLRRLGLRAVAASGATRPEDVGAAVTDLPRFADAAGLLDALGDARLGPPERRRRPREPRARGRRNRSHES